jgi:ribose/xylose/arabinose/galactoside ABC-type transport system permease subunit
VGISWRTTQRPSRCTADDTGVYDPIKRRGAFQVAKKHMTQTTDTDHVVVTSNADASVGDRRSIDLGALLQRYAVAVLLLGFSIFIAIRAPRFRDPDNIANILDQISVAGIIAMGMTMLLITANFDLSIGGIVALSGMFLATVANSSNIWLGIVVAIIVGASLGAINGFIVVRLGVNSLVATLGAGFAFGGVALLWHPVPVGLDDGTLTDVITSRVVGVRTPVFVLAACMITSHWLLRRTILGRYFFAAGANTEAARFAGVPLRRVQFIPFVITGSLCGVASAVLVGQLGSALPDAGTTLPLEVIAAVVVGGVSISGGVGSVGMAFIGVLLLGVIANGFNMLNLDINYSKIFTGAILVLAVAVDAALRRRRRPVTVR